MTGASTLASEARHRARAGRGARACTVLLATAGAWPLPGCGEGAVTLDGGNFEDTGPGDPAVECSIEEAPYNPAGVHADAISSSLEFRCDDPLFANYGLAVAPTPDGSLLLTTGNRGPYLFRAEPTPDEDTSPRGARIEGLPPWLHSQLPLLTLDSLGQPIIAGSRTTHTDSEPGSGSGLESELFALLSTDDSLESWTAELVASAAVPFSPIDLAVDPDGHPNLWYRQHDNTGPRHAEREGLDAWEFRKLAAPTQTPSQGPFRFVLSSDGTTHTFGIERSDGFFPYVRHSTDAGTSYYLTDLEFSPLSFLAVGGPRPGYAEGSVDFGLAAITEYDNLFSTPSLLYAGSYDVSDLGVPPLQPTCTLEPDACTGSCLEQGEGLRDAEVALARTNDGRLWLAWLHTTLDIQYTFDEQCHPGGCYCENYELYDRSTAELRIGELDPMGGLSLGLRIDLGTTALREGLIQDPDNPASTVVAQGFGDRLSVGLRLRDGVTERSLAPVLQLVEIDTSRIPD